MTQCEKLDQLMDEHNRVLQITQVLEAGIAKPTFYAYIKERKLEKAAHGVYVSPDAWTNSM